MLIFPTDYKSILERIEKIKPIKYAQTRNFVDGDVTYLSPYISRGVISLPQIAKHVLATHKPYQIEKFLKELAWREYWQRVWQNLGNKIFTDIKQPQEGVNHHQMLTAFEQANTGITAIDMHIQNLYNTGYMHNHLRMYVSCVICNVGKAHWLQPAAWMYYHFLDGDLASNSLSWQWIAGSFSSKKYYCNQENINRYTHINQTNTFLDCSYEVLTKIDVPTVLELRNDLTLTINLPKTSIPIINTNLPTLIYNSYNLDPMWHLNENVNRILLLEPSHFKQFPVSDKVIKFMLNLSKNIDGLQILVGEFSDLKKMVDDINFVYKKHPAFTHYQGKAEEYDYLFPTVNSYFPSFSSYWKKCENFINR